jgi:hypothetical protein
MTSGSYGPMILEFLHVASASVEETTYLVVSLKNGAPGSSSTVRVDHDGFEHLVGPAPEQDASALTRHRRKGLSHLGVEAVVERPRRRVDHAVEAHELVYVHRSHVPPPRRDSPVSTWPSPRIHRSPERPSGAVLPEEGEHRRLGEQLDQRDDAGDVHRLRHRRDPLSKALTDDEARTLSCPAARRTPAPRRLAEQAQALIATSPTCTSGALTDRCVRLVAM